VYFAAARGLTAQARPAPIGIVRAERLLRCSDRDQQIEIKTEI